MNNMQKWKAGWTGPDQKIKYRKAASREEIDDLVFLSRVISVIAEDDCTEFIFLECDLVSFISVKYFDDGKILVGRWKKKDNPSTSILFRNEFGQLQALRKENKE